MDKEVVCWKQQFEETFAVSRHPIGQLLLRKSAGCVVHSLCTKTCKYDAHIHAHASHSANAWKYHGRKSLVESQNASLKAFNGYASKTLKDAFDQEFAELLRLVQ